MIQQRKKVTIPHLYLILLLCFSCNNIQTTLETEQVFTKNEIKDLNKITNFFAEEYLKSDIENFESSFKEMFEFIWINGFDTLNAQIDFNKQKSMYETTHQVFDQIWEIKSNKTGEFKGEEYIVPKYQGKFFNYMKILSNTNSFAKNCYEDLIYSGDFYYFKFANYIATNFDNIDFNDFNNQLIISIYFLTAVDDDNRDENRKKRIEMYNKKVKEQYNQID